MARILFLEPETPAWWQYYTCMVPRIASKLSNMGHEVIEITRPSPRDANDAIKKYSPHLVWWAGKSGYYYTSLENEEIWISTGRYPERNMDILDNTIAVTSSAFTASEAPDGEPDHLGPALCREHECNAYFGYKEYFRFPACIHPCPCGKPKRHENVRDKVWYPVYRCTHEASLHFVIAMARGKTVREAYWQAVDRFDYWIDYFKNIDPQNTEEEYIISLAKSDMEFDKHYQRYFGDPEATIPTPVDLRPLALLGTCVGLAGVTYFKAPS